VLWFWPRANSASKPGWALLENAAWQTAVPDKALVSVRLPLKIGAAAGVLFAGIMLLVRIGLRLGTPLLTRQSEQFAAGFGYGQAALAGVIQAAAAVLVHRRARRLRVASGPLTAFVAGCVMAAAALVLWIFLPGGNSPFVLRVLGLAWHGTRGRALREGIEVAWGDFQMFIKAGALLSLISIAGPPIIKRVANCSRVRRIGNPAAGLWGKFKRWHGELGYQERTLALLGALLVIAALASQVGLAHRGSQILEAFKHDPAPALAECMHAYVLGAGLLTGGWAHLFGSPNNFEKPPDS